MYNTGGFHRQAWVFAPEFPTIGSGYRTPSRNTSKSPATSACWMNWSHFLTARCSDLTSTNHFFSRQFKRMRNRSTNIAREHWKQVSPSAPTACLSSEPETGMMVSIEWELAEKERVY